MSGFNNPKKVKKILGLFSSLSTDDRTHVIIEMGKICNNSLGKGEMEIQG